MRRTLPLLIAFLFYAATAFAQTAFDFPNTPTANQIVVGPSNQQFQWDGKKWVALLNAGVGGGFTAGGDLSGTSTAQTVIGLQTKAVPSLVAGYLHWNGTAFVWDTPAGGSGGGIAEAPTDGNAYLRANSAWTSGGTIANDIIVSAVHLTNLSGWAPLNFGNPNLAAGTSGAVTASLFAYNGGVGGNNNLNITAGAHMWNGNWVSDTPTAEGIVLNPTSISLQYSTGNTVGATLGTWNTIGTFASNGLTTPTLHLTNETTASLMWPHGSMDELGSSAVPYLEMYAGGYWNGSQYIATSPTQLGIQLYANSITFGYSGAAVGSPFSATAMATMSANGINLPTGENYMINGVPIGGGTPGPGSITDAMLANAYSGIGACGAGTFVSTLNRNAAPTCTAATVSGYLPLTGGTLSGPGNLTVNGTLTQNGNAQFGGGATISFGLQVPNWISVNGTATFNGATTAPTVAVGDNSTNVATTAFVKAQGYAPLDTPVFVNAVTIGPSSKATNTLAIANTGGSSLFWPATGTGSWMSIGTWASGFQGDLMIGTYNPFGGGNYTATATSAEIIDGYYGSWRFFNDTNLTAGTSYTPTMLMRMGLNYGVQLGFPPTMSNDTFQNRNGGATFSVAAGGSQALCQANDGAIVFINDTSSVGQTAIYLCSNTICSFLAQSNSAGEWVASTTTPAANTSSVALNSQPTVYNGWSAAHTYHQMCFSP